MFEALIKKEKELMARKFGSLESDNFTNENENLVHS